MMVLADLPALFGVVGRFNLPLFSVQTTSRWSDHVDQKADRCCHAGGFCIHCSTCGCPGS
jgi:hypothetical protein